MEFLLDGFYFLGKLRGQDICLGHELGGEVNRAGVLRKDYLTQSLWRTEEKN